MDYGLDDTLKILGIILLIIKIIEKSSNFMSPIFNGIKYYLEWMIKVVIFLFLGGLLIIFYMNGTLGNVVDSILNTIQMQYQTSIIPIYKQAMEKIYATKVMQANNTNLNASMSDLSQVLINSTFDVVTEIIVNAKDVY